ncbi:MAG: phosphoglycolate phosphatase [Alphaproteobacteria bacterium]|nr:phosphoglycolate phosphatase [Alphaproteobacteria bacterium]
MSPDALVRRPLAVVFDLDGTLVDSAEDLASALDATLTAFARPTLGVAGLRSLIGDGAKRLVEDAWRATGEPADDATLAAALSHFRAEYDACGFATTRLYPGVEGVLVRLAKVGIRAGVCTNKPGGPARTILRRLGLASLLPVVIGSDETKRRKPDPEHLYDVLARLGVAPEDAVYVGDNEHDAAIGRLAGCRTVLVRWGYCRVPIEELPVDALVSDAAALSAALGLVD